MVEKNFGVIDEAGLHARPAALLVNVANEFASEIKINYKEKTANLKSILGVMGLGIPSGVEFKISAEGIDEQEAIDKLQQTLKNEGLVE